MKFSTLVTLAGSAFPAVVLAQSGNYTGLTTGLSSALQQINGTLLPIINAYRGIASIPYGPADPRGNILDAFETLASDLQDAATAANSTPILTADQATSVLAQVGTLADLLNATVTGLNTVAYTIDSIDYGFPTVGELAQINGTAAAVVSGLNGKLSPSQNAALQAHGLSIVAALNSGISEYTLPVQSASAQYFATVSETSSTASSVVPVSSITTIPFSTTASTTASTTSLSPIPSSSPSSPTSPSSTSSLLPTPTSSSSSSSTPSSTNPSPSSSLRSKPSGTIPRGTGTGTGIGTIVPTSTRSPSSTLAPFSGAAAASVHAGFGSVAGVVLAVLVL